MRFIGLIAAAAISAGASASFDLMLVQAATADAGGLYRVHRIDPENGVNLGSFLIGPQSIGLAASYARGEMYTLDINGNLRTWNYSTGSLKSVRNVGWSQVNDFALSANGNEIVSVHGNGELRIFNLDNNSVTASAIGVVLNKINTLGNNAFIGYSTVGHSLRRMLRTGNSAAVTTSEAVNNAITPANVSSIGVLSSAPYHFIYTGNSAGSTVGFNYGSTVSNDLLLVGSFTSSFLLQNSVNYFTKSHLGLYAIGADSNSTGVRVNELDTNGYILRTNVYSGISGGARNAAIVLAPEPGPIIALGLGVAALLSRRRRKSL